MPVTSNPRGKIGLLTLAGVFLNAHSLSIGNKLPFNVGSDKILSKSVRSWSRKSLSATQLKLETFDDTKEKSSDLNPISFPTVNSIYDQNDLELSQQAFKSRIRKGSVPEFVIEGDSTKDTPFQRGIVGAHFFLVALNIILALLHLGPLTLGSVFCILLAVGLSYVVGDFGTGVFHWSVDNYGSLNTPLFGSVCTAFQGHHETPWTITFRTFPNNVYKICSGTIPALLLTLLLVHNPYLSIFLALFINWWLLSQELHKYAHMKKPPNKLIGMLQDANIIISRKEHGLHHSSPFEGNYCIVNGMCNSFLDETQFFRHLEKIVYKLTGK